MQNDCFSVIKARATARTHKIKIRGATDSFAAKLSLMVHHHKLERLVKQLDCCVQGQDHSDGWKLDWMFVSSIFCVPQISLYPN